MKYLKPIKTIISQLDISNPDIKLIEDKLDIYTSVEEKDKFLDLLLEAYEDQYIFHSRNELDKILIEIVIEKIKHLKYIVNHPDYEDFTATNIIEDISSAVDTSQVQHLINLALENIKNKKNFILWLKEEIDYHRKLESGKQSIRNFSFASNYLMYDKFDNYKAVDYENASDYHLELFQTRNYKLFLYLNENYNRDDKHKRTKYSNLYHFFKDNDLIFGTHDMYKNFILENYNVNMSKILAKTLKYDDEIKILLTNLMNKFISSEQH